MVSFDQYSKTEEEHSEFACLFADHTEEFAKKYKLNKEKILVLLEDTIKYVKEEWKED